MFLTTRDYHLHICHVNNTELLRDESYSPLSGSFDCLVKVVMKRNTIYLTHFIIHVYTKGVVIASWNKVLTVIRYLDGRK